MTITIFRRVFLAFSLTALLAVGAFLAIGLSALDAAYGRAGAAALERTAGALAASMPAEAAEGGTAAAAWCASIAEAGGYRATVIAPGGRVVADSEAEPGAMENHASRPEVASALAGRVGSGRRRSATLGKDFAYAAAPIAGGKGGALRLAIELPSLRAAMSGARGALTAAAAVLVAALVAAAAATGRSLSAPISRLAAKARAAAGGAAAAPDGAAGAAGAARADGAAAAPESRAAAEELGALSEAVDAMTARIAERAGLAEERGRRLAAVLDAIPEAVIATDRGLRVISLNRAASALFGGGESSGKSLLEAIRSTEAQGLASECLDKGGTASADISLFLPFERAFSATCAPILGAEGRVEGLVLILSELTEMRRLERVRRDFVANVSHELRTPVQLIKGFSEALADGALGDPEKASRFVGLIGRNAERMEELISDLLALASLERGDREAIDAEASAVLPLLEAAREAVSAKASAAGVEIATACEPALEAVVNAGLLEQAVVNLLDNAVKFSPRGSRVDLKAEAVGDSLRIELRDRGVGIPSADLGRIFERFYRVDKARSRDMGGTGLGLAIVRHIAMAHGGSASVESWEGEGSTFTLILPLAGPRPREGSGGPSRSPAT